MKSNKLADYIVKTDTNQSFSIELTENVLAADMISYVVVVTDLSEDSAWDDSFFETFKSAELADKFIQEFIDKHHAKLASGDGRTTVKASSVVTATGVEHDFELNRDVNVWRSGFVDVTYTVTHSWGLADGDDLCAATHDYKVEEYDTYTAARYAYGFNCKEDIDAD